MVSIKKIIDNWEDLSQIDNSYWDELCEYHLKGIGLQRGEKWENEEFLTSGMIPMELINLQKVRKYLGLDVSSNQKRNCFSTNMAKSPKIPTGYNEDLGRNVSDGFPHYSKPAEVYNRGSGGFDKEKTWQ